MNNTLFARTPEVSTELALTADNNIDKPDITQVSDEEDGSSRNSGSTNKKDTTILSESSSEKGKLTESSSAASNDDDGKIVKGDDSFDDDGKIVKGEEKNPWNRQFIGIPVNYFSVGVIYGGSVSGKSSGICNGLSKCSSRRDKPQIIFAHYVFS